jgi:hypothetical protein
MKLKQRRRRLFHKDGVKNVHNNKELIGLKGMNE